MTQPQPQVATEPERQPGRSSGALSLKDKLQLNRKAKAHGLPALWPEAEEYEVFSSMREKQMRLLGLGGPLAQASAPFWRGDGWQGGLVGPLHGLQNGPNPGGAYGSTWGVAGAFGDPASGRNQAVYCAEDPMWPPSLDYDPASILSMLRKAANSLFSLFRGPLPW